jgi:flagellar biosynthetic protein FlhB
MPDDVGERTEEATPRRLKEAKEEGKVARSQDLSAAIMLLLVTAAIWFAAEPLLRGGKVMLERTLGGETLGDPIRVEDAWHLLWHVAGQTTMIVLPLLIVAWVAAWLSQFVQVGWMIVPKSLTPKGERLDPIQGAKRIFGIAGVVKVSLDSLKIIIVLTLAGLTAWQYSDTVMSLMAMPLSHAITASGWMMFDLSMRIVAVLMALGLCDFVWQRLKFKRDMRMTRQQVKDELKDTEGDPQARSRRRRMQQQIAMQRVNASVPTADVIVTNPEHISIALKYDADTMRSPVVVAKGADHLAMKIRQIAKLHAIPIIERKPLARALYRQVKAGQPIPETYFKAVAEILAYVYRLQGRAPQSAARSIADTAPSLT